LHVAERLLRALLVDTEGLHQRVLLRLLVLVIGHVLSEHAHDRT
jgi:hypothetical protein